MPICQWNPDTWKPAPLVAIGHRRVHVPRRGTFYVYPFDQEAVQEAIAGIGGTLLVRSPSSSEAAPEPGPEPEPEELEEPGEESGSD